MLPIEQRTMIARVVYHVMDDAIIVIEDMDVHTQRIFIAYEKSRLNDELDYLLNHDATPIQIASRRELRERHQGWIAKREYDSRFQGYIAGAIGVSDHVLGETLAVHLREAIKILDAGKWDADTDPFNTYVQGFEWAHTRERKVGVARRCLDLVARALSDPSILKKYMQRTHALNK